MSYQIYCLDSVGGCLLVAARLHIFEYFMICEIMLRIDLENSALYALTFSSSGLDMKYCLFVYLFFFQI